MGGGGVGRLGGDFNVDMGLFGEGWAVKVWFLLRCLSGLQILILPVSSHDHLSVHICVLIFFSYKDTRQIGLGAMYDLI